MKTSRVDEDTHYSVSVLWSSQTHPLQGAIVGTLKVKP